MTEIAGLEKNWFDQWKDDIEYIFDFYADYDLDGYDEMVDCYCSIPWLDNEV